MKLTPYEIGKKRPREHFPDDGTEEAEKIEQARRDAKRELERRQALVIHARPLFATAEQMAVAIGTNRGSISRWMAGRKPVPAKHVEALERLVRGDSCE